MLLLKLLLAPLFIGGVSLAGKRWGPAVGGWLSGFPIIVISVLFILSLERGATFAAETAVSSLLALFASIIFVLAYAQACVRMRWLPALLVALSIWFAAAVGMVKVPHSLILASVLPLLTLLVAPRCFPKVTAQPTPRSTHPGELFLRMTCGVLLTFAASKAAETLSPAWSGMVASIPITLIVLGTCSHRTDGSTFVVQLFRATIKGFYSYIVLCLLLAILLSHTGIALSFLLATGTSLLALWLMRERNNGSTTKSDDPAKDAVPSSL